MFLATWAQKNKFCIFLSYTFPARTGHFDFRSHSFGAAVWDPIEVASD